MNTKIVTSGFLGALLLVALLWVGTYGAFPLPPLGRLLDPVRGIWLVAVDTGPQDLDVSMEGLDGPVTVVYDDRAVPHIFATTSLDASRALGYVVARDRLFQMELQTRATAGTLTELVGETALRVDRNARNMGMAASADRAFEAFDPATFPRTLLVAYADGVNAWIDGMPDAALPMEYHLTGTSPARWEPVHTLYHMRQMGLTLAGYSHDLRRVQVIELVGEQAADALFPIHSPIQEPIQPNRDNGARYDALQVPPPRMGGAVNSEVLMALSEMLRDDMSLPDRPVGASNNWTVSGARTASGHALLAGDPHLDLSLPSVWYEVHLVVPGEFDVYGVTFPGVPGIVIGFNRNLSWSFTNTGADVMDFYEETLDDPSAPLRYMLDGEWRDLGIRVEAYRGKRGELLATDTIYSTHRGPIRRVGNRNLSMRWTVLETSTEVAALDGVMRASSVEEWRAAMRLFRAPAQNGVAADVDGNIGLQSFGWYPLRADDGNGLLIRDGTTSASDWQGEWEFADYPGAVNPEQGYLASANQEPIDPRANATFLGADWYSPWRAIRINELLRGNESVTPDDMRSYQTDPGSARARYFLPFLIGAVSGNGSGQDAVRARDILSGWNAEYTKDSKEAVLFEWTMDRLRDLTWDELAPGGEGRRVATPEESILWSLMHDPENPWWDRMATEQVEVRDVTIAAAMGRAYSDALARFGEFSEAWRWENIGQANIEHLIRSNPLSRFGIPVQAGIGTLGAWSRSGKHGPSWRMVVEMGPEVRAWVTYPGGQSGNPTSPYYDDRIEQWSVGELDEIMFPRTVSDLPAENILATIRMEAR